MTVTFTQKSPQHDVLDDDAACPRARQARALAQALPDEQLETEVVTWCARLGAGTYELLVLIGEVDARQVWAMWGALSCAAWLAAACDIESGTARRQVRVARAMRAHPVLDEAMRDGDVSYAKARVLVSVIDEHNAGPIVDIARITPAARLGAAIAAWVQRHDDPETIERRQTEERRLSWHTRADGMVEVHALLTPEAAGEACAVIDTVVRRDRHPGGASLAQQRADALVAVCRSGGEVTAEVIVHVGPDGNTMEDGTPLADHAVAAALPDSFVSLLIHDAQSRPIDASPRRRFPTRRQRRVVDARQHECAHPGCHAAVFLQYDHVMPAGVGGPTVVDNLQRLCGPHNRAKERAT